MRSEVILVISIVFSTFTAFSQVDSIKSYKKTPNDWCEFTYKDSVLLSTKIKLPESVVLLVLYNDSTSHTIYYYANDKICLKREYSGVLLKQIVYYNFKSLKVTSLKSDMFVDNLNFKNNKVSIGFDQATRKIKFVNWEKLGSTKLYFFGEDDTISELK